MNGQDRMPPVSEYVDARIISLYSKNTGMDPVFPEGNSLYGMFEYYEALEVEPVKDGSPLLNAYRSSRGSSPRNQDLVSRQILLAFTDVRDAAKDCEGKAVSFTKEEINSFWANYSQPILFMSLINVENPEQLKRAIERIGEVYPKGKYLVYFTLDHCDIVIFFRGSSFQEYAKLIFDLDYGQDSCEALLVDSITLYALNKDYDYAGDETPVNESFGVYLQFGVADAERMDLYYRALEERTGKDRLSKGWILGRYDVGILNRQANLEWLLMAKRLADELPNADQTKDIDPWYTIHTISILIEPTEMPLRGRLPFRNVDVGDLREKLFHKYAKFEDAYRSSCTRLKIPEDEVWLRWLKDTFVQAALFFSNNMTINLGVCLVPQFLDFFAYAEKLWGSERFGKRNLPNAERDFFTLFTNVSILIDSMNHNSRQFIMTSSFRTVSFDIPPQIMAYYIAVTHRLIDVFQDDDAHYGFTISPKFARELDVGPLAQQEIVGRDQFITIGIGEESLYRLQYTMVPLAHEISHQVGDQTRNRALRKQCVLLAELHNILNELALRLHKALVQHSIRVRDRMLVRLLEEIPAEDDIHIPWLTSDKMVKSLLEILGTYAPEYLDDKDKCFKRDLSNLLKRLPRHLSNNPALAQTLFEFLWEELVVSPEGTTYLGRAMGVLALWYYGLGSYVQKEGEPSFEEKTRMLNGTVRPRVFKLFQTLLKEYADQYERPAKNGEPRRLDICNLFSETFADLQALLLFKLDWREYCELFCRTKQSLQKNDRPRLVAIAATIFQVGDLTESSENSMDDRFKKLWRLSRMIRQTSEWEMIEKELYDEGIDPAAIFYLMKYLPKCSDDIKAFFGTPKNKEKVKALTDIYDALSDQHSIYQVLISLKKYIERYRDEVQRELMC